MSDAALILQCHPNTLYALLRTEGTLLNLTKLRLGGSYRIATETLVSLLRNGGDLKPKACGAPFEEIVAP